MVKRLSTCSKLLFTTIVVSEIEPHISKYSFNGVFIPQLFVSNLMSISCPWIHPSYLSYLYQVFDLRHCYEEMQRQAREACVAVAAQTAAVRGIYNYSAPHTCTYMYMCLCILGLGRRLQNNIRSFVSKNEQIFEGSHVFLSMLLLP